jgi:DNA repair exonuclease SbcCD ATPase subunit
MMAAMGRAGAQSGMSAFDRIQGEMSRQAGELDRILAEQREILNETEKIDKEMRRSLEEEVEKNLSQSRSRLKEILEKLETSLPHEQADSIKELERLLETERLERFSQLLKELEEELSGNEEAQKRIRELKEIGESFNPDPKEIMEPDTRTKFPGLSSRQENLKERTKSLKEKLEMIAQLFPGMDTEIFHDIKGAEESMGDASKELRKEDAPGAIPPEQEAIRRLSKSQQSMQQMAQQMAMRMQAMRWGYPLVYDPRAGWYYGPWIPQPTLPQPEFRRPREKGFTGIDREEFEPPSKDAYRVPKIFREKVMESLKEEVPSQYRREVERYFRGLTE